MVYDDDMFAYCKHSHECSADNPNSTINIIKNGKLTPLHDYEKALEMFAGTNNRETIKHMVNPITLRLLDVRHARHIESVCEERDINISDYIRELIEQAITNKPIEKPKQTDESELTF